MDVNERLTRGENVVSIVDPAVIAEDEKFVDYVKRMNHLYVFKKI